MTASLNRPLCDDEARRALVRQDDVLNGIDHVEVDEASTDGNPPRLTVHFIDKDTEQGQRNLSDVLDRIVESRAISIQGGTRVRSIEVVDVTRVRDHLEVGVSESGDLSRYTLAISDPALDPVYTACEFTFRAGGEGHFDCRPGLDRISERGSERPVDYMAKDYASFRQALIDLIPALSSRWKERHEADLGISLVELLAYAGDRLSYYQDAVANEAYLETARQRVSVRRHARLIDYRMHDGISACTFIHLGVRADTAGTVPQKTQVLTYIDAPLGSRIPPHGPVLPRELKDKALAAAEAVFETTEETRVHADLNRISIHSWGNLQCCLPQGTTAVDLVGKLPCVPGDFLLFEEVIGPETGLSADADPTHRQVVRITEVESTRDPLLRQDLTRISWDPADALTFPLCVSTRLDDRTYVGDVTVARGNLVLADHGRTVTEWHPQDSAEPRSPGIQTGKRAYRFRLRQGPLSFRSETLTRGSTSLPARGLSNTDPRRAVAQVSLDVDTTADIGEDSRPGDLAGWTPVPDLFDSDPFSRHFVVETENDGRATLRFGDNQFGMAPPAGSRIRVTYRIGVGTDGNVGPESLVHVVNPGTAEDWPDIETVRNPMNAWAGEDEEAVEQVKQLAPAAFHMEQLRAVTEEDYAFVAEKHPDVSRAMASFRWTGSWHTVFVTIDPKSSTDVPSELRQRVRDWIIRHALADYDVEINSPTFVPLEVEADIFVAPDHFRSDVEEALLLVLSNQPLPDGQRGLFHPDNFTFGQALYLSKLYAAIEAVNGVDSAMVTKFQRFGQPATGELEQGYVPVGRLESIRLDNDPNYPENGILRFNMLGGR